MKLAREDAVKELFKITPGILNYIHKNNENIYNLLYILVLNGENLCPNEYFPRVDIDTNTYIQTHYNIYYYYSSLCHITFNLFVILECHHIPIANDPNLSELYHLIPDLIIKLIYLLSENPIVLKNGDTYNEYEQYECTCNYYYNYRSGIEALMDEYEEINEYITNIENLEDKLIVEYPYTERNDYRLYNLNFINPSTCCHDKIKMINELNHWKKYFHTRCPCKPVYSEETLLEQHCCYCIKRESSLEINKYNCKYIKRIFILLTQISIKNNNHIPYGCVRLIISYI